MINLRACTYALASIALAMPIGMSQAEVQSKSKKVVVLEPADLPLEARIPGEGFFTRSASGGFVLYVEQDSGTRLVVFDVSDPGHIKVLSSGRVGASGSYDFVKPLGDKTELVRYRNGAKLAVLDVSKDASPLLRDAAALKSPGEALVVDKDGSSDVSLTRTISPVPPHDFEVLDADTSTTPEVITTVRQVERELTNDDTGTTFLLNRDGLTVVRRTDKEEAYRVQQQQIRNQ